MQTQSQNLTSFVLDLSEENRQLKLELSVLREALTQTLSEYDAVCRAYGLTPFIRADFHERQKLLLNDKANQS